MKNVIALFVGLLLSSASFAQDCNIGNQDTTGFSSTDGYFQANFLLGVKFPLLSEGVLNSLNLIGRNTGAQVQMALYDDNNGVPNDLIVSTGITTVGSGIISLPVSPMQLIPGDYWIMAIYDVDSLHTYKTLEADVSIIYYDTLTFGEPIPSNASSFISYTGRDFTYFLDITCGALGIHDLDTDSPIEIYPNPSADFIHITTLKEEGYLLEIIDELGIKRKTIQVNSTDATIDIRDLCAGTYLILIDNLLSKTIIVE